MPVRALGNDVHTYNATNITAYLDQASLDMLVEALDVTNLASSGMTYTPGVFGAEVPIGGAWDIAIDNVFGADTITPPTTTLRTYVRQVGPSGNRATYTWTGSATVGAFISEYKIFTDKVTGILKWSGKLTISGSPVRS